MCQRNTNGHASNEWYRAFSLPGPIRSQSESANWTLANSLPGTYAPWPLRSLAFLLCGLLASWNFCSLALSLPGLFAPGNESSMELLRGIFVPWNFRSFNVYLTVRVYVDVSKSLLNRPKCFKLVSNRKLISACNTVVGFV